MFENVIGQPRFVERIQYEIQSQQLPSALLFSGEEASGKLTAALELSRVKSCQTGAEWKCQCADCCAHRLLKHPRTLLLGKRNFIPEIKSAVVNAVEDDSTSISALMLIRSIAKLTSRFNPIFEETGANIMKKATPLLERLDELLLPLYDSFSASIENLSQKAGGWYNDSWSEKLIDTVEKLQGLIPQQISVNEIRAINYWSHTSGQEARTVIIDEADSLNLSAANALLKILEEPPAGLTFILLTHRRGALLSTILSRLRLYDFQVRTKESQQEVLRRVFRLKDTVQYSSVKEYLYRICEIPIDSFETFSTELILSLLGQTTPFSEEHLEVLDLITDRIQLKAFLEILIATIQNAGKELSSIPNAIPVHLASYWNQLIREAWVMNNSFNQSSRSLLESLFLRMRKELYSSSLKRSL